MIFDDLLVSLDLFEKTEMRQFGARGTEGLSVRMGIDISKTRPDSVSVSIDGI